MTQLLEPEPELSKEKVDIACKACGKTMKTRKRKDGTPAVPVWAGWKEDIDGAPLCNDCFKQKYVPRSLVFPLVGPFDDSGTWEELRAALKVVWGLSTTLANIAQTTLYVQDSANIATLGWRPGTGERMPPLPKLDLYKLTKPLERGWVKATAPATGLLRAVQNTYVARRFDIHTGQETLGNFRYPYPYPVHNSAWKVSWEGEKIPVVSVPLAGRRWRLRLKSGERMRRQLAGLEKIIAGQAMAGEISIYRVRANQGDHRSGASQSSPGGGPKQYYRVMIKIAAYLPRTVRVKETKMLPVAAKEGVFLQAADGFTINADHARTWVIGHMVRLHRLAEDTKYEKRLPKRRGLSAKAYRRDICRKFRHRMKTFQQQTANSILKYALRNGYAGIDYDDSVRKFFPSFEWAGFRQILVTVAENLGATVNFVTAAPPPDAPVEEEGEA